MILRVARTEKHRHKWIGITKRTLERNDHNFLSQGSEILTRETSENGSIDRTEMRAETGIVSRGTHHGRVEMSDYHTANPPRLHRIRRRQTNRSATLSRGLRSRAIIPPRAQTATIGHCPTLASIPRNAETASFSPIPRSGSETSATEPRLAVSPAGRGRRSATRPSQNVSVSPCFMLQCFLTPWQVAIASRGDLSARVTHRSEAHGKSRRIRCRPSRSNPKTQPTNRQELMECPSKRPSPTSSHP